MPSVIVRKNENFEFILRRFKRACERAEIVTECRARQQYEKPTWKKKRLAAAAVKRHQKRLSRENSQKKRLY